MLSNLIFDLYMVLCFIHFKNAFYMILENTLFSLVDSTHICYKLQEEKKTRFISAFLRICNKYLIYSQLGINEKKKQNEKYG